MKTPKLNIAIADVLKQFGIETIALEKLANLLLDYRAFEEYPSTKPILRDILKKGYGAKLLELYQANKATMATGAVALVEEYSKDTEYKKDHVQYVFDCLLFGLGVVKQVNEPFSNSFDPYAAKGDILDTLDEQFNQLRKQYVDLLDKLAIRPNDILHDAAGYYEAAALTQLYAVEAKINVLCQELQRSDKDWCKKQLEMKLNTFKFAKEKAVQEEIRKEQDNFINLINSALILPKKFGIKLSGYLDPSIQQEKERIAGLIVEYYSEINRKYDNWCEEQEKELLAKHHVGFDSMAKQVALIYVLPAIIIFIALNISIKRIQSSKDIETFDTYIALGDSLCIEQNYIEAMSAYYAADTAYHGNYFPSRHHSDARNKLQTTIRKFQNQCDALLKQRKLSQVKPLVESIPPAIRKDYPNIDTKAKEQLRESVNKGLEDMIKRVSATNGKLTKDDKEYLNELILVSEDTYWLNIIKKKSK